MNKLIQQINFSFLITTYKVTKNRWVEKKKNDFSQIKKKDISMYLFFLELHFPQKFRKLDDIQQKLSRKRSNPKSITSQNVVTVEWRVGSIRHNPRRPVDYIRKMLLWPSFLFRLLPPGIHGRKPTRDVIPNTNGDASHGRWNFRATLTRWAFAEVKSVESWSLPSIPIERHACVSQIPAAAATKATSSWKINSQKITIKVKHLFEYFHHRKSWHFCFRIISL